MYQSQTGADLRARTSDPAGREFGVRHVRGNVWALGFTSLFTDMSSEMVAAVLPAYAIYFLKMSPAAFGAIDSLQQGGASLVKLLSGWLTDRSGRYKSIAAAGYASSVASRLGLVVSGANAAALTLLVAIDRLGKGIRTAPRDAIISLSVDRRALAAAFGVHRALDTTGAVLGPLLGFLLLQWIHDGYDVVFVAASALGAIGLAVLITFVRNPATVVTDAPAASGQWPPLFLRAAAAAGVLGLATISDSFIYLTLQRSLGLPPAFLPLMFIATPTVYLTFAVPVGRIADRIGAARVILLGYLCLVGLYWTLNGAVSSTVVAVGCVLLLGMFYAATDGVFAALASAHLPQARRSTGLALISTCNDVGRMIASLAFGWWWSHSDINSVVLRFQLAMVVAVIVAGVLLWPMIARSTPEARNA